MLTITSTFLDLGALLIVVGLLSIFFAIAFMLFIGGISASPSTAQPARRAPSVADGRLRVWWRQANFSTFGDSLLSMWLLTLGNIEYLDLLWREGPGRIYEREGSPDAMVQYVVFHWMIVVILMSLFIAVLTAGYEKAKMQVGHPPVNG